MRNTLMKKKIKPVHELEKKDKKSDIYTYNHL